MKVESLDELAGAFSRWRKKKRYIREAVPEELWVRVIRAAQIYGASDVARATRVEPSRLMERSKKAKPKQRDIPGYSQISITAPSEMSGPIAEVETATGVTLRIFVETDKTVSLLSSLCGKGEVP